MARKHNFLLGNGERLTSQVQVPKGGGDKNPPYEFAQARARTSNQARFVAREVQTLKDDACPGNEVVVAMTMHPRYLSKSDFPSRLLNTLGLHSIGTKSRRVKPESWGIDKHPEEAVTEQIFVAGPKDRIAKLDRFIEAMAPSARGADELSHVEEISFTSAKDKLRWATPETKGGTEIIEVVLHNLGRTDILQAFVRYATGLRVLVDVERLRKVGGLTFVPIKATRSQAEILAEFSFVRVVRSMPTIRPVPVSLVRGGTTKVMLPSDPVASDNCRALIFDGGIPDTALGSLSPWVTLIEPAPLGPPIPSLEEHGLGVTSAFLFGPILNPTSLNQPFCAVDHVRVIDTGLTSSTDPYYYDVLDRILRYFDAEAHKYSLMNLSLGPQMPIEDDDVTVWTAEWDARLSTGDWLVTVAAGNDGDRDHALGYNRIQPPSDGVNVLTIGACDRSNGTYARAIYSCIGPGRRPGYRKPDGLLFGGSREWEMFGVLGRDGVFAESEGTSFAAPYALRLAAGAKAQLGSAVTSLAVRALMIHSASNEHGISEEEIGWGRFELDPARLITCEDHEVTVIYQGQLSPSEYLRAPIPLPPNSTKGMVEIEATLVISTEVDAAHASAYTRRGVEVFFRPHDGKFAKSTSGKSPKHPKTSTFLSAGSMYGRDENSLRESGFKWEPTRRGKVTMRSTSLQSPCIDIYHHHRQDGVASTASSDTQYALVVTIRSKQTKDLYNKVVRAYSHVLIPLQPQVRIEIR